MAPTRVWQNDLGLKLNADNLNALEVDVDTAITNASAALAALGGKVSKPPATGSVRIWPAQTTMPDTTLLQVGDIIPYYGTGL